MKFGMLFPGYGSQFVGMGKELYDTQRLVQEYFEEAATCLSINFVKLCFASSEIELAKPCHAYTSLFLMGASSAGLLKERALQPDIVGSVDVTSWYSSLFAAGNISLPDGLYILNKLGTIYEEVLNKDTFSAILVKDGTKRKIEQLCAQASTAEQMVSLANIVPQGFIVVGHTAAIEKLQEALGSVAGVTYEAADIGGGLYISAAEEVALQVTSYLEKIDFKDPQIPVLSPLNGKLVKSGEDLKYISRTIFVQQLDQLAVFKKITQHERLCIAIPAGRLQQQFAQALVALPVDTMENVTEFEKLVEQYRSQEESEDVE